MRLTFPRDRRAAGPRWRPVAGWRTVVVLALLGVATGCGPARVSGEGARPPAAGTGGPAGPSLGLPPGSPPADGGLPCGPQIEGPPIPCPDAAVAPDGGGRTDAGAPSARTPMPALGCPGEGPVTVAVRAWGGTPTCVYLRAGESVEITASGRWRARGGREVGPEGASPAEGGCNRGALVARVGKFHQRTCIGARSRFTAQRDGYLWLFQSGGDNAMESGGEISATIVGGGRSTLPREGLTPLADDPRVDPARIAAFEKVCGREVIPVHFEAEQPEHPRVKAYVAEIYGGDPVAVISRNIVIGCALFYATPEEFPASFRQRRVRVVHYVTSSARRWGDLDRPPLRNARGEHWDFDLTKTLEEITSMQPDYGPFGGPPVSIMHEVGHLIAPDGAGGKLPKWLTETYAESLPANLGGPAGFHHAIDNPESGRFGGRSWWCDGTFGGPTFLDFVDERHPGFIHFLTRQALRIGERNPWPGSDTVFRMFTGQSFDALWAAYADVYQFRSNRPVSECLDPQE